MKKLLCVAVSLVSVATLAACGNSSDEFAPSLNKETSCKIQVAGSYDNFEALEAEFERFNDYYPNVRLSYTKLDDYNNSLANALDREDGPNIFFSYTWMMGNEKYAPVISHMEKLSDSSLKLNLDCIRPGLINKDAKGDVYMVPVFSRTYGTLINNDLFKKEGINIPTTWSELFTACEAFAEKGYKSPMMGYTQKSSSSLMNTVAYPSFVATLAKNPSALELANNLDPAAGEYMRESLNQVKQLVDSKAVDLEECDKITGNYDPVILRFFEGDVPMMVCAGDTASGTKKREAKSEAFKNKPFEYSYLPIPSTDKGGYFIDSPSIEFSVNKDCQNLDMTNEFMRFLVRKGELNNMASLKRLVTPTKDLSYDSFYSPFGKVPEERTYSPEALGIKDQLTVQIRVASFKVAKGEMTIDEAIKNYGKFE